MQDLDIKFKDTEYKLPARGPKGRMLAAAKVEGVVTLAKLSGMMQEGDVPHIKLCMAYSQLLQHVGCTATPEDVLEWLFEDSDVTQDKFGEMLSTIMLVMTPQNMPKSEVKEVPLDKSKPRKKG